jgi:hypothetical protein
VAQVYHVNTQSVEIGDAATWHLLKIVFHKLTGVERANCHSLKVSVAIIKLFRSLRAVSAGLKTCSIRQQAHAQSSISSLQSSWYKPLFCFLSHLMYWRGVWHPFRLWPKPALFWLIVVQKQAAFQTEYCTSRRL